MDIIDCYIILSIPLLIVGYAVYAYKQHKALEKMKDDLLSEEIRKNTEDGY